MTDKRDDDRHEFSAGQGVDAEYEEFTLDPEEIDADPNTVDPVDSRVLTDIMDKRNVESDAIDVERLIDVGLSYMGINQPLRGRRRRRSSAPPASPTRTRRRPRRRG